MLVAAIGIGNTYRLERRVESLTAACIAEDTAMRAKASASTEARSFTFEELQRGGWEKIGIGCDPKTLVELGSRVEPVDVQRDLVDAQQALDTARANRRDWLILGIAIAVILGLPWLWYFLLDRIKELRHAITGK
jgi:hypothetical protein